MHGLLPIPTKSGSQVTLAALAEQIKSEHQLAREYATRAIGHAIKAGTGLNAAKARLQHGEWLHFLRRCDVGDRTAQRYMQLARLAEAKSVAATDLTGLSIEAAVKKLSPPKVKRLPVPKSETELTAPSSDIGNSLQWTCKTINERRHFLDAIGLKSLLEAVPPNWLPVIEAHFVKPKMAPQRGTAELPADLSMPGFLKRSVA
jgi:hypothetical protein